MTVISLKAGTDPEVFRVGLSDGSLFSFRLSYLGDPLRDISLFQPGEDLSGDAVEALRFSNDCLRTETAALGLAARAEQTVFGITRKLENRGHSRRSVADVVARLEDLGLISDRRYAELWLSSRIAGTADSPLRMVASLCRKGIPREAASAVLRSLLPHERETELLRRFMKKNGLTAEDDPLILRSRILSEGFSRKSFSSVHE